MKGTPDQVGADQSFGGVREIGGRSCSELFGSDIEAERGEPESGYPEQYDSSDRSDSVEDCQSDNNDEISQDSTGDGSEVDASSENSQFETEPVLSKLHSNPLTIPRPAGMPILFGSVANMLFGYVARDAHSVRICCQYFIRRDELYRADSKQVARF